LNTLYFIEDTGEKTKIAIPTVTESKDGTPTKELSKSHKRHPSSSTFNPTVSTFTLNPTRLAATEDLKISEMIEINEAVDQTIDAEESTSPSRLQHKSKQTSIHLSQPPQAPKMVSSQLFTPSMAAGLPPGAPVTSTAANPNSPQKKGVLKSGKHSRHNSGVSGFSDATSQNSPTSVAGNSQWDPKSKTPRNVVFAKDFLPEGIGSDKLDPVLLFTPLETGCAVVMGSPPFLLNFQLPDDVLDLLAAVRVGAEYNQEVARGGWKHGRIDWRKWTDIETRENFGGLMAVQMEAFWIGQNSVKEKLGQDIAIETLEVLRAKRPTVEGIVESFLKGFHLGWIEAMNQIWNENKSRLRVALL